MVLTKLRLIFLLVSISNTLCEFQKPNMLSDQFFVHQLISEYLKAEQHLWTISESRTETTLNEIYSTNKYFLNKSLDIPMEKTYRYGAYDAFYVKLINSEIGDPVKFPIQKDRPNIFLSQNLTSHTLEAAEHFFNIRNDIAYWNGTQICYYISHNMESSYQAILYNYEETQLVLLEYYITSQILFLFQNYYLGIDDTFKNRAIDVRNVFKERFLTNWENVQHFIQQTNKDFRRCDEKLSADTDYLQITQFLSHFVDNEVNLNQESSCTKTCSDFKRTNHYQCAKDTLCNPCEGIVRDCEDSSVKTGSWTRWFVKCSNCLCICDEKLKGNSNRYFSLRDVVSDTSDNKIVTAVRVLQKHGIIQLGIAQRKLFPFGKIVSSEGEELSHIWNKVDIAFNISDAGVRKDIDYHELTYDQRAFNLDTVTVPKDHLVTGVRFHVFDGHLSLQVRATEFNYATGQLKNIEKSQWMSNHNGGKNKINLQGSKNPILSPNKTTPYTAPDAYVEFSPGIYDHENKLKQFTVPFFNPIAAEPYMPTILSGVGFFFAGSPEYAGLIDVKLVVYDFKEQLLTFTLD